MPNTPALVGLGMTGLMARDAVTADDKALVEREGEETVIVTTPTDPVRARKPGLPIDGGFRPIRGVLASVR
jgi:hypothetical protein